MLKSLIATFKTNRLLQVFVVLLIIFSIFNAKHIVRILFYEIECNSIERDDFIKLYSTMSAILEIGPFTHPGFKGENVKYFDVLDREGILERAKKLSLPLDSAKQNTLRKRHGQLEFNSRPEIRLRLLGS